MASTTHLNPTALITNRGQVTIDMTGRLGMVENIGQDQRNIYGADGTVVTNAIYNPLVRSGYLSPGNRTADNVTGDQSFLATFGSSMYDAVNDDFYLSESGIQLFKGDTTTDTTLTRLLTLGGTNQIYDMEIYQVNGVRKMFVMYNTESTGGHAEIAISNLPYDTATDDLTWLTATVSGHFTNTSEGDIFMLVSDNGFAYLFMENQVHKIDGTAATGGTNATITPNALLFPTTFRMVDAIDYRGFIYIALHQYRLNLRANNPGTTPTGPLNCGVYIWDRNTTVAGTNDYIPIPQAVQISKIFMSPSGKLRAIIVNNEGATEIVEYTGSAFEHLYNVGYGTYPVYRDSVATLAGMNIWNGKDGVVYGYGKINTGTQEGLYPLLTTSVSSLNGGVVLVGSGTGTSPIGVYVSYLSAAAATTIDRFKIFTVTGQFGGSYNQSGTEIYYPVKYLPPMSTVRDIYIVSAPSFGSGGATAATINVRLNNAGTQWASKTVTQDNAARGYYYIPVNKEYINSIQLSVVYPSSVAISTSDYCPVYALVNYERTPTKG